MIKKVAQKLAYLIIFSYLCSVNNKYNIHFKNKDYEEFSLCSFRENDIL